MILHAPPPLSLPFPCPALRELTCDSCGSVSSQVVHVEDGVFSWDKADKPTLSKYVLDSFHPQLELNWLLLVTAIFGLGIHLWTYIRTYTPTPTHSHTHATQCIHTTHFTHATYIHAHTPIHTTHYTLHARYMHTQTHTHTHYTLHTSRTHARTLHTCTRTHTHDTLHARMRTHTKMNWECDYLIWVAKQGMYLQSSWVITALESVLDMVLLL